MVWEVRCCSDPCMPLLRCRVCSSGAAGAGGESARRRRDVRNDGFLGAAELRVPEHRVQQIERARFCHVVRRYSKEMEDVQMRGILKTLCAAACLLAAAHAMAQGYP